MSSFTCDVHKTHSRTFLSLSLLLMLTPGPAPPAEMLAYLFLRKRDLHHSSDKPVVVLVLFFLKNLLTQSFLSLLSLRLYVLTSSLSLSFSLSSVSKPDRFVLCFAGWREISMTHSLLV